MTENTPLNLQCTALMPFHLRAAGLSSHRRTREMFRTKTLPLYITNGPSACITGTIHSLKHSGSAYIHASVHRPVLRDLQQEMNFEVNNENSSEDHTVMGSDNSNEKEGAYVMDKELFRR